MDALDVETSVVEGEQALQALLKFVSESAGRLEAHEAEKGIFKRLLPIGLAAMKLYFAQRGARGRRSAPGSCARDTAPSLSASRPMAHAWRPARQRGAGPGSRQR